MDDVAQKKIRLDVAASSYLESDNDNAQQTSKNSLDANAYLTYDILRIVFQYLNARDLSRAGNVCRSWCEAALVEKRIRGPSYSMIYWDISRTLYIRIRQVIKNLRIEPSLILYFISMEESFYASLYLSMIYHKRTAIMLKGAGILMDNLEIEGTSPNAVGVFLSPIPNMIVKAFKVTGKTVYSDHFRKIFNDVSKNKRSVCLMLFSSISDSAVARNFLNNIRNRNGDVITSLWGGVIRAYIASDPSLNDKNNEKKGRGSSGCIGVLIGGFMQTWSIVVNVECNTEEQVEARLTAWKNRIGKLGRFSMGFMFACQGRGITMYDKENVESSLFKKLFPKIPLVGCFGDGEFGKDTIFIPNETNATENSNSSWYHEYSTIFMILTYD